MQHTHKRKRTIASSSSGTYSDVVDDLTHILAKRKAATIIQQSATSSSSSQQQQQEQQKQKHDKPQQKVANNHHSHNEKKQKNTDWIQQLKQQYNNLHDKVIDMIVNHYHPESSSLSSPAFDSQLFNHIISGRSIQLQQQQQQHFLSMSSSSSLTMTMNTLFLSFAHLMFKHNIQYESHGVMCLIVLPNDSSVLYWYQHLMNHFITYSSSSNDSRNDSSNDSGNDSGNNESDDHKDNDMLGMIMANHGDYHNNNNNHLKSRIIMCSESSLDHLLSSSNEQEQQNDKDHNNNNNNNNTVVEQIKLNGVKCLVHLTSSQQSQQQQQQQQATIVASKISQLNPWKKQYIANYDMKTTTTIASSLNFNLSSIESFHSNDDDDDADSTNGDEDGSNNNRKYEMEEHIVPFNDKLLSLYYLLNDWTVAESNQDKKKKKQKQKHKRVIVLFDNEYMLMYVYYALQRLYKCLLGQSSSSSAQTTSTTSDNLKTKHNVKDRAPYLFVKSIDYHQPQLQKKNKKRTAGGVVASSSSSSPFAYTNDNQFNDILSFIHSKQSSVLFATAGSIAALPVIHNASDTIMILYDQPADNNKCSIIPVIALCETQPFDDRYNCTRSDHSHLTLIIQKQIQKSKLIQKYMQLLVSHLNEYAHFQSFAVDHAHLASRSTQLKPIIEQWLRSLCISETNYSLYLDALQNKVKQVVDKKNRDAKKQESLSL